MTQNKETAHSPLPWTMEGNEDGCGVVDGYSIISSPKGKMPKYVADMVNDSNDAAHIVKCVNSHDVLVESLNEIYSIASWLLSGRPFNAKDELGFLQQFQKAEEALRKVGVL